MKDMETDYGALAREYVACMGAADRVRWLDMMIQEVGGIEAPIPAWEDLRGEAAHFFACCLSETTKVYVAAGFDSLNDADKRAFVKWAEKRVKKSATAPDTSGSAPVSDKHGALHDG